MLLAISFSFKMVSKMKLWKA